MSSSFSVVAVLSRQTYRVQGVAISTGVDEAEWKGPREDTGGQGRLCPLAGELFTPHGSDPRAPPLPGPFLGAPLCTGGTRGTVTASRVAGVGEGGDLIQAPNYGKTPISGNEGRASGLGTWEGKDTGNRNSRQVGTPICKSGGGCD